MEGKKMELTVLERVLLLGLLPAKENFLTLKLIRSVKDDLSFDDKEHKALGFKAENKMTIWDQKAGLKINKDISIGEIAAV